MSKLLPFILILSIFTLFRLYEFYKTTSDGGTGRKSYLHSSIMLRTTAEKNGVGNLVFQIVSFLGIARSLNRTALMTAEDSKKILKIVKVFPHLFDGVHTVPSVNSSELPVAAISSSCCVYTNITTLFSTHANDNIVNLRFSSLTQSFKYFSSLSLQDIRNLLRLSEDSIKWTKGRIVDEATLKKADHKICVHTRRTNFKVSAVHAWSTNEFTRSAVQLLKRVREKKKSKIPLVIVFGEDQKWMEQLFSSNETFAHVIASAKGAPSPAVLWYFSYLYCDSFIQTASASTFGWWSSFLLKGQQVFYNTVFSRPNGFKKAFRPDDFFPKEWIPLEYDTSTKGVGIRPPYE